MRGDVPPQEFIFVSFVLFTALSKPGVKEIDYWEEVFKVTKIINRNLVGDVVYKLLEKRVLCFVNYPKTVAFAGRHFKWAFKDLIPQQDKILQVIETSVAPFSQLEPVEEFMDFGEELGVVKDHSTYIGELVEEKYKQSQSEELNHPAFVQGKKQ